MYDLIRGYLTLLSLLLSIQVGVAEDRGIGLPGAARLVTSGIHKYDEVLPACSPDGRWLAFEYHEISDPDCPHVGIMRVGQGTHSWRPLLRGPLGGHVYVGDFSWSPDSRWLAVQTDYPGGEEKSFRADTAIQVAKVNIYTDEVAKLTKFPPGTGVGPTTAWLRSGTIVFAGADQNIYEVSEKGGNVRKLVEGPTDQCKGVTNTFAVSPDERKVAFAMHWNDKVAGCNALWIADLRKGNVHCIPTTGLHPCNPFWLNDDTILFSGESDDKPTGIYRLSLNNEKITRILAGPYITPFVCDSDKTLYFSWGAKLRSKPPAGAAGPIVNTFSGFHIWKVPLCDVLP